MENQQMRNNTELPQKPGVAVLLPLILQKIWLMEELRCQAGLTGSNEKIRAAQASSAAGHVLITQ